MADTLIPIELPPGVYRNGTLYQSRGRWHDAHLVRFVAKTIQPIGGWHSMQDDAGVDLASLDGSPRGAIAWRGSTGDRWLGLGTTQKLYILAAGTLSNVTPSDFVASSNVDSAPVSSGAYGGGAYGAGTYGQGSATAVMVETDNWALDNFGDYLVGVCTSEKKLRLWAGNVAVPAYDVARPAGAGTATAAAGAVTFSSSQAGNLVVGDSIIVASVAHEILTFNGTTGATISASVTFGASAFVRAVKDAPTAVTGVVVTPEGFLVALGWSNGVASVRGLTWASQRTSTVWTPAISNSAGDFDLTTNGRILAAKRTRSETLIWTDCDLHVMEYIGGPFVYKFTQAGDKCGAISPRAPVVFDTKAMWMGRHNFYMYDGFVKPVPCEVQDYVFGDFNEAQAVKVWGTTIAEFGEAWWFYPSAGSVEVDRYVAYNYRENHWTIGRMKRNAGCDAGALPNPVMISNEGVVFEHELMTTRPTGADSLYAILTESGHEIITESGHLLITESSPTRVDEGIKPYLISGPIQIGEGDRMLAVQRLIPDEQTLGDVEVTIYSSNYPTDPENAHGPYSLANPTDLRINAREMRLQLVESVDTDWRVGVMRLGVRESSRR